METVTEVNINQSSPNTENKMTDEKPPKDGARVFLDNLNQN